MAKRKRTGPNKMDLVRSALAAGIEKPLAIVEYLKKQGTTISANQVSNYKSVLKRGSNGSANVTATNGRRGRKPGRKQIGIGGGFATAVAQLKQLVKELGAEETRKLVEVLS